MCIGISGLLAQECANRAAYLKTAFRSKLLDGVDPLAAHTVLLTQLGDAEDKRGIGVVCKIDYQSLSAAYSLDRLVFADHPFSVILHNSIHILFKDVEIKVVYIHYRG